MHQMLYEYHNYKSLTFDVPLWSYYIVEYVECNFSLPNTDLHSVQSSLERALLVMHIQNDSFYFDPE